MPVTRTQEGEEGPLSPSVALAGKRRGSGRTYLLVWVWHSAWYTETLHTLTKARLHIPQLLLGPNKTSLDGRHPDVVKDMAACEQELTLGPTLS